MSISWATNLLHFHRNKVFKSKFCILTFDLATDLATFKILGEFFLNHLVTLDPINVCSMTSHLLDSYLCMSQALKPDALIQ
jgi:hypothetical protein